MEKYIQRDYDEEMKKKVYNTKKRTWEEIKQEITITVN